MMKKTKIAVIAVVGIFLLLLGFIIIYPNIYDNECKNRHYSDLEKRIERIISSNIGIIGVDEREGVTEYSVGSSGVIFSRENERYFALTAYHVTADMDRYLVLTTKNDTFNEYAEKRLETGRISLKDYYEQLAEASVEYACESSDIAIISFECNEELSVITISDDALSRGDKLAVVGALEGKQFETSYGTITSKEPIVFIANDEQSANKAFKHSAYVAPGSSGGAVLNSEMKLIGINIGGGVDWLGRFKYGVMIPCDQVQQCIDDWKNQ